jgi:putative oxidoreductase
MASNATVAGTSGTIAGNGALVLVSRVLISILFISAGFAKLTAIGATAGWFGSIGLPAPTVVAVVVGLLEFLGGLAILVGFKTRIAAVALGVFTLAATAVAHLDFSDQIQVLMLEKNLAIVGGFILLAIYGAGSLSIDGRRG